MSVPLKARSWEIAVILLEKIKYTFGKPIKILTDNESEFINSKSTTNETQFNLAILLSYTSLRMVRGSIAVLN